MEPRKPTSETQVSNYFRRQITLKPRCETIGVQVIANRNTIGVTRSEEADVFIGSCLVVPQEFTCPVSILNITENEMEVQVLQITIEEIATNELQRSIRKSCP